MARYYLITLFFFTLSYHCMRKAQGPRPPAQVSVSGVSSLRPDALKELLTELAVRNFFISNEALNSTTSVPKTDHWWCAILGLHPGFSHRSVVWRKYLNQFPGLFQQLIMEIIGYAEVLKETVENDKVVGLSCNLEGFRDSCKKLSISFRFVYHILSAVSVKKELFVELAKHFKGLFADYIIRKYPDPQTEDFHRGVVHGVPCLCCLGKATEIAIDPENSDFMIKKVNDKTLEYRVKIIFECILVNIIFSLWDATTFFFQACLDKLDSGIYTRVCSKPCYFMQAILKLNEIVGYLARINYDFSTIFRDGFYLKLKHPDKQGHLGLPDSFCYSMTYSIPLTPKLNIDFDLGQGTGDSLLHQTSDATEPISPILSVCCETVDDLLTDDINVSSGLT